MYTCVRSGGPHRSRCVGRGYWRIRQYLNFNITWIYVPTNGCRPSRQVQNLRLSNKNMYMVCLVIVYIFYNCRYRNARMFMSVPISQKRPVNPCEQEQLNASVYPCRRQVPLCWHGILSHGSWSKTSNFSMVINNYEINYWINK